MKHLLEELKNRYEIEKKEISNLKIGQWRLYSLKIKEKKAKLRGRKRALETYAIWSSILKYRWVPEEKLIAYDRKKST